MEGHHQLLVRDQAIFEEGLADVLELLLAALVIVLCASYPKAESVEEGVVVYVVYMTGCIEPHTTFLTRASTHV